MLKSITHFKYWNTLSISIICLIIITYAFYFLQSAVVLDTARDIHKASEIVELKKLPLIGPDVGGFFHLGPIWYYFLAIPMLLNSLAFMAFFVGFFAGLKFYFAYKLGSSMINQKFGLLWASMLLIPGWHSINQFFITHTNLIESLSLLFLFMLLQFHLTHRRKYMYLAGLVFGLGFHAHPSFLALVVFFLAAIWVDRKHISTMMLLIFMALFSMPLIPYLFDQLLNDFPDWTRWMNSDDGVDQLKATGKSVMVVPWWQHWFDNTYSMLIDGPKRILDFISYNKPSLGIYALFSYWLIMAVVIIGIAKIAVSNNHRKHFLIGVLMFALSMLLVVNMRTFTPFYMILSISPVLIGLLSLSAYVTLKNHNFLLFTYVFILFCLGLIPYFAFHKASKSGQVNLGQVMNITKEVKNNWQDDRFTLDMISIKDAEDLSIEFCEKRTVINGPLTAVLDFTSGATIEFHCDSFEMILGGQRSDFDQSLFLMHKSFWDKIGLSPIRWMTPAWGVISDYQNHATSGGISFKPFNDYIHPPRSEYPKKPFDKQLIVIKEDDAHYLALTNVLPANVQFKVNKITANEQAINTVIENAANRLYYCETCVGKLVEWRIELTTNDLNAIDINTFAQ